MRDFLRGLLSDPRVVELPRLLWWPVLNGFILPFRPGRKVAAEVPEDLDDAGLTAHVPH